jgi:hypothetical protein
MLQEELAGVVEATGLCWINPNTTSFDSPEIMLLSRVHPARYKAMAAGAKLFKVL